MRFFPAHKKIAQEGFVVMIMIFFVVAKVSLNSLSFSVHDHREGILLRIVIGKMVKRK